MIDGSTWTTKTVDVIMSSVWVGQAVVYLLFKLSLMSYRYRIELGSPMSMHS